MRGRFPIPVARDIALAEATGTDPLATIREADGADFAAALYAAAAIVESMREDSRRFIAEAEAQAARLAAFREHAEAVHVPGNPFR
jgi:hypothetical protein